MSYSIPIRNRYKACPGDATVRSLSLRSATRTVMGHTRCVSLPLAAIPSACPKRCPARRQVPQFHAPRMRDARAPSDTLLPHSASEHDRTLSDARRRLHTRATSPHRPPLRKQEPFATHSGGKTTKKLHRMRQVLGWCCHAGPPNQRNLCTASSQRRFRMASGQKAGS